MKHEEVFHHISKHRENALRGVWICDETLFRVFHITSKTNAYFRRKLG